MDFHWSIQSTLRRAWLDYIVKCLTGSGHNFPPRWGDVSDRKHVWNASWMPNASATMPSYHYIRHPFRNYFSFDSTILWGINWQFCDCRSVYHNESKVLVYRRWSIWDSRIKACVGRSWSHHRSLPWSHLRTDSSRFKCNSLELQSWRNDLELIEVPQTRN